MRRTLAILALGLLGGLASRAQAAEGKISGYMFGDYYYNVSGPAEKQNGFQVRRLYLTYDAKWSDKVSGRFRLEANDARFSGGTGKMTPYVKESSVTWKQERGSISVGLVPTFTWALPEKVWGYRPIEKTILDLSKAGTAVDLGVSMSRQLGGLNLQAMVANGKGTDAEVDNDKKIMVQGAGKLAGLEARVYGDWQSQPGGADQMTIAGLLGRIGTGFHGGIEALYRIEKKAAAGGEDRKGFGISVYGAKPVGEHQKVFARADLLEPNGDAKDDQSTLLIGGLDWALAKDLHLMPNVLVTLYQDSNKDTQIVPRLTGFFEF